MAKGWLYPWALGSVTFGGASLLVPLYVVELGGDAFDLGVLGAAAALVGVPGAIAFGRWADRTGKRRPYVLAMLALTTAMLVALPLVSALWVVILANAAIWFAFASAMPVLTLLAVTGEPPHAWSGRIATLNKYQGVGWALGLLLGMVWIAIAGVVLESLDAIRSFFLGMAVLAAVSLVVGRRWFPPDDPTAEPVSGLRLRSALRRADSFDVRAVTYPLTVARVDFGGLHPRRIAAKFTPALALYFVAIVLMFSGFAAFFAPLPAFLTEVGFAADAIFALYLVSSLASVASFGAVGRLAASEDVAIVQTAGLVLRGVAFPAVALVGLALGSGVTGFGTVALVFVLIGATWAVITVTAGTIVTHLTPVAIRGEALGMYAALTALAGGIGAVLGGWIAVQSFPVAFTAAGGLIVVGAAIVFSLREGREVVPEGTAQPATSA